MNSEQFLESWEQEKQRLAALGHQWSLEDALRFSICSAGLLDRPQSAWRSAEPSPARP